ncbi:MAG: DciA family protein [Ghiorsea sp.]|nr:DciA family protein [Ghiorsea sp.]
MATHRKTRKSSELKSLNISMNKIIDSERMQRLTSIAVLRRHWHDIVGSMMAERCEPIAIEPQVDGSLGLIIAVNHSVIADMIRLEFHENIRKACFTRCKLQGLRKVWTRVQANAGIREEKKVPIINAIHCHDLRLLAQSIQGVKDKPLRRGIFRAAAAQLKFTQIKKDI